MAEPVKIAYVLGGYTADARQRRIDAVLSRAGDSIDVHFIDLDVPMIFQTLDDCARAEPAFIEAFRQAEADGCQAVIPDGMVDLGVEAGRSSVRIPVIAPLVSPDWLSGELGLPVVDGISAPLHIAAGLVRLGLTQSPRRWQPARR